MRIVLYGGIPIILAFAAIAYWLFLITGPQWPPIADPAKLRQEASLLCEAGYSGEVPKAEWPESIAALHPRAVFANRERVRVMISSEGTTALPYGYEVYPDNVQRPGGGIEKYDAAKMQ